MDYTYTYGIVSFRRMSRCLHSCYLLGEAEAQVVLQAPASLVLWLLMEKLPEKDWTVPPCSWGQAEAKCSANDAMIDWCNHDYPNQRIKKELFEAAPASKLRPIRFSPIFSTSKNLAWYLHSKTVCCFQWKPIVKPILANTCGLSCLGRIATREKVTSAYGCSSTEALLA